jgi:hypothetical protein
VDGTLYPGLSPDRIRLAHELENRKGFECTGCGNIYCMGCLLVAAPALPNGGKGCIACGKTFRRLHRYEPKALVNPVPSAEPSERGSGAAADSVGPPPQVPGRHPLDSFELALVPFYWSQANRTKPRYEEAVALFSDAIAGAPEFAAAFQMRAKCYRALGQVEKSEADSRTAERLLAGNRPAPVRDAAKAQVLCQRVRNEMERGGLISDSLLLLHMAIDADPECIDAYDIRADIYFNLQMPDESLADIQRVGDLKRAERKPFWKRVLGAV